MTLQEAKQQVDACEREITSAYNNIKSAARDVGSAGYSAALSEKARIENDANGATAKNTMLSLLISLFGFILCCASYIGFGICIFIVGMVIAYSVYQLVNAESSEKIGEAKKNLNSVDSQQTYLNNVINQNETI